MIEHPSISELERSTTGAPLDEQITAHLRSCDDCSARVHQLEQEKRAFYTAHPRDVFVSGVNAQLVVMPLRPKRKLIRMVLGGLVAAAAAVFLALDIPTSGDAVGLKGEAATRLHVWRADAHGKPQQRVTPPLVLRPGETILFELIPGKERFVFIGSVDETGKFSRYFPTLESQAVEVVLQPDRTLPVRVELDDYLGEEWLVGVFADHPLDHATIEGAVVAARAKSRGHVADFTPELDAKVSVVVLRKVKP